VTDTGLDRGDTTFVHPDLLGRVGYAHDFTADPDATDCGGHGTNVTSIAAGVGTSGQDAQGYRYGLGVAPYAKVGRLEDLPFAAARPPRSTTPN
jgi:hypothetical protein